MKISLSEIIIKLEAAAFRDFVAFRINITVYGSYGNKMGELGLDWTGMICLERVAGYF
jgi:hypothetical protein